MEHGHLTHGLRKFFRQQVGQLKFQSGWLAVCSCSGFVACQCPGLGHVLKGGTEVGFHEEPAEPLFGELEPQALSRAPHRASVGSECLPMEAEAWEGFKEDMLLLSFLGKPWKPRKEAQSHVWKELALETFRGAHQSGCSKLRYP